MFEKSWKQIITYKQKYLGLVDLFLILPDNFLSIFVCFFQTTPLIVH